MQSFKTVKRRIEHTSVPSGCVTRQRHSPFFVAAKFQSLRLSFLVMILPGGIPTQMPIAKCHEAAVQECASKKHLNSQLNWVNHELCLAYIAPGVDTLNARPCNPQ
jgi:hypothetical protein